MKRAFSLHRVERLLFFLLNRSDHDLRCRFIPSRRLCERTCRAEFHQEIVAVGGGERFGVSAEYVAAVCGLVQSVEEFAQIPAVCVLPRDGTGRGGLHQIHIEVGVVERVVPAEQVAAVAGLEDGVRRVGVGRAAIDLLPLRVAERVGLDQVRVVGGARLVAAGDDVAAVGRLLDRVAHVGLRAAVCFLPLQVAVCVRFDHVHVAGVRLSGIRPRGACQDVAAVAGLLQGVVKLARKVGFGPAERFFPLEVAGCVHFQQPHIFPGRRAVVHVTGDDVAAVFRRLDGGSTTSLGKLLLLQERACIVVFSKIRVVAQVSGDDKTAAAHFFDAHQFSRVLDRPHQIANGVRLHQVVAPDTCIAAIRRLHHGVEMLIAACIIRGAPLDRRRGGRLSGGRSDHETCCCQ